MIQNKLENRSTFYIAATAGALHLAFALFTLAISRSPWFWDGGPLSPFDLIGIPFFWVPSIAAFAAGMIPIYGYLKENLVSPLILLAGWFAWGSINFVSQIGEYPIAFLYLPEFLPPPNYDYFHQSILLAIIIGVLYIVERYLRRKEMIGQEI